MMSFVKKIIAAWIDCIFPPLCEACKEPAASGLFCSGCWELCAPPDPKGRCRHCFGELDLSVVCRQCRNDPFLPIPSSFVFERSKPVLRLYREAKEKPDDLAAFALFQWERLGWPIPDVIIPLPEVVEITKVFAKWLDRPCVQIFRLGADLMLLEEDSVLLLISESDDPFLLQERIKVLGGAFPKKIYSLSLLHDDFVIDSNSGSSRRSSILGNEHCSSAAGMDCSASW